MVSDLDALRIIDFLEFGENQDDVDARFSDFDVSFDDVISAFDALLVINFLNSGQDTSVGLVGEDVSVQVEADRDDHEAAIDAVLAEAMLF